MLDHQNQLSITGKRPERSEASNYVHRGIASWPFETQFAPTDQIDMISAGFENGLRTVVLKCAVPEAIMPYKCDVSSGKPELRRAKEGST